MATTVATAQPRQTRTITSSTHSAQQPLSLRPVLPEVREAVAHQVEKLLGAEWRISHRFNEAKDRYIFSNETLYAWKREGRERPGILVLGAAGQPAVYWDMDRDEPYALRFQIPFGFLTGGYSVFIATLLRGERRLIFEDVWVRGGTSLCSQPFSARWRELTSCYKQFSTQQLYLGFDITIVEPVPLQDFLTVAEPGTIWDFQPETSSRNRIYYVVPGARVGPSAGAQVREAEANAHIKLPVSVAKHVLKKTTQLLTVRHARCCFDITTPLPDSYNLESSEGTLIGRACVPKLAQSQLLRATITSKPGGFPVEVAWHSDFKKYEIIKILPDDTPLTSASAFFELAN